MAAQLLNRIGQLGLGLAVGGAVVNNALYNVDGGHRAVIFDRFAGVKAHVVGEGTHFMVILFCRSSDTKISQITTLLHAC